MLEDGHPAQTFFGKVKRLIVRVRSLIHSMQRFNLLDTEEIFHTEVALDKLIEKIKNIIGCSNVTITYNAAENFILKADATLLYNLFEELITNSCKFKHPARNPEINITADIVLNNIFRFTESRYKYENFVRIKYTDNGIGFKNEYSKQIFELFRKLQDNDGVGIGLPYCKKIVDMHHGIITVESAENVGTKFTILLPLEPVYTITKHLNLLEKF